MKAKFLALAALVLGMVSCQTDVVEGLHVDANGEAELTLQVGLPEATRAAGADSALGAIGNVDMNEYDIRFILKVYDDAGKLAKECEPKVGDATEAKFSLRLVPGRDYRFVVWADFVTDGSDLHYNTSNFPVISLKDGADQNLNDESRDAYTAVYEVKSYSSSSKIEPITLTRPFAKLRVITTDMNQLYSDLTSATVTYTSKLYTSFNALDQAVVANSSESFEKTVVYGDDTIYTGEPKNGEMTLFADYFFGSEDNRVMFTLDVADKTGYDIPTVNFNTNIPVNRNYLTTVKGNILTDANEITVEIKDAFENEDNTTEKPWYVEIISGVKTQAMELTEGSYLFEDVTFNVENAAAIVVKSGNNVVMDLMGVMNINAKEGIVVEDGATLTINGVGVADTRGAVRAGNLIINTSNGSAIGGDNITINNLAGLTAKANGDHAFGIGSADATVNIENTKIDYVCGGHVQPLFVNDTKYGKSEPEGAAAIGGANVVIKNSTITKAEGGSKAAAIGNRYWESTNIVIENSTLVDIFGGNASAAIGGSRYSQDISADNKQVVKVKIENSTITNAVGGQYGAGIGSGYDTHCAANETNSVNEIVIAKSNITAKGGKYSAGIGTGFHAAALTGSIDVESTINATSGDTYYKPTYTTAQNVGYAVIDPDREGKDLNVTFTVAGKAINIPTLPILGADDTIISGLGKDYINEDNYYISEPDALYYITEQVNGGNEEYIDATINLSNDIDLLMYATRSTSSNWTPIGTEDQVFEGTFDGKGYTIKNLNLVYAQPSYYIGFFGCVENATIKNITFDNVYVNVASDDSNEGGHIAAIAGYAKNTTFENITVKGDVKVESTFENNASSRVAVVAGGNYGGEVVMKNVVVNANDGSYVKANNCVGALAGQLQGKVVFEDCSSNIDVTGYKFFAGGLIGLSAADSKFVRCSTSGDVTITNGRSGNNNDLYRVGGIVGGWDDNVNTLCLLTDCSYTGKLSGASADGRTATAFDCGGFVGRGYSALVGAKINVNGTVYEYAGNGVYKVGENYVVATADALVAALANNYDVFFDRDIKIDPANMSNAYGKTGINVTNGQAIDGNGHTINIRGAGGTWDSGINTTGGVIKNITVTGSFRGIFVNHNSDYSEKVVLENVTIDGTVYTISCDQGKYQGLEAKDSTFNGWTSYAATIGDVKFMDCSFGEGSGYAFCRPYAPTEFVGCAFEKGFTVDPVAAVSFENCTLDGVELTNDNIATLVTSTKNVTVK